MAKYFSVTNTRELSRGRSFNFAGELKAGTHYRNDDYTVDFVTYAGVLLACVREHIADDNTPTIIYDTDEHGFSYPTGISKDGVGRYWEFVVGGIPGGVDVRQFVNILMFEEYKQLTTSKLDSHQEQINKTIKFEKQTLTQTDQTTARSNISAASNEELANVNSALTQHKEQTGQTLNEHRAELDTTVKFTPQTLSTEQQEQARINVSAASNSHVYSLDTKLRWGPARTTYVGFVRNASSSYRPTSTHKDVIFFATDTQKILIDGIEYGGKDLSAALQKLDAHLTNGDVITKVEKINSDKLILRFYGLNGGLLSEIKCATSSSDGFMSKSDKAKLDNLSIPEYDLVQITPSNNYAASYQLTRDGKKIGATINIPKDMVVSSGKVKTVTATNVPYTGAQIGDLYIELQLANSTSEPIYIPANKLVDKYVGDKYIEVDNNNILLNYSVLKEDLLQNVLMEENAIPLETIDLLVDLYFTFNTYDSGAGIAEALLDKANEV